MKRILLALAVLSASVSAALCDLSDGYGGTFLNITTAASTAPGTTWLDFNSSMANFTALQNLSRVSVAYVNASGTTNLTDSPWGYTFEFVNQSTGKARLWIRVPYLDSSGGAVRLCYSQAQSVGNDNETAVFSKEFTGAFLFEQPVNSTVWGHNSAGTEVVVHNGTATKPSWDANGNGVFTTSFNTLEGAYYSNFTQNPYVAANIAVLRTNLFVQGNTTNYLYFSLSRPSYAAGLNGLTAFNYTPYYSGDAGYRGTPIGANFSESTAAKRVLAYAPNYDFDTAWLNYSGFICNHYYTASKQRDVWTSGDTSSNYTTRQRLPRFYDYSGNLQILGCSFDGQTQNGTLSLLQTDGTQPVKNASRKDLGSASLFTTKSATFTLGGSWQESTGAYSQMNATHEAMFISLSPPAYAQSEAWLSNFNGAALTSFSEITEPDATPQVTLTLNNNESEWGDDLNIADVQASSAGTLQSAVLVLDGVNFTLDGSIGSPTFALNGFQPGFAYLNAGFHTVTFCANTTTGEANCTAEATLNVSKDDPCQVLSINSTPADVASNVFNHADQSGLYAVTANVSSYLTCSTPYLPLANVTIYLNGTEVANGLSGPNDPVGTDQQVLSYLSTLTAPAGQQRTYVFQLRYPGDANTTALTADDSSDTLGSASCGDGTCQRLVIQVNGGGVVGNYDPQYGAEDATEAGIDIAAGLLVSLTPFGPTFGQLVIGFIFVAAGVTVIARMAKVKIPDL